MTVPPINRLFDCDWGVVIEIIEHFLWEQPIRGFVGRQGNTGNTYTGLWLTLQGAMTDPGLTALQKWERQGMPVAMGSVEPAIVTLYGTPWVDPV